MSSSNGTNNTPSAPSWLDAGAAWAAPATGNDGAQVPAAQPPATRATAPAAPLSRPAAAPEDFPGTPPIAPAASTEQARPSTPPPSAPSAAAPFQQGRLPRRKRRRSARRGMRRPGCCRERSVSVVPARSGGWRHLAYQLTGGRWNPGLSEAEARLRDQLQKIRTPLPGPHSVVVASIKGGIGKTTVSALLGLALAEHRGDRVIAVDANPDAGTLGDRLVGETHAAKTTVRDLLHGLAGIRSATDLAGYTHLAARLQVLTSEQEPELSETFSATDYTTVLQILARYANAIVTDSGTGIMHSAMQASLRHADSLVIVGAPTNDGASRAARTFRWLAANGYRHLTEDAVVVLSYDRHSPDIDDQVIRDFFAERCRAVIVLPRTRTYRPAGSSTSTPSPPPRATPRSSSPQPSPRASRAAAPTGWPATGSAPRQATRRSPVISPQLVVGAALALTTTLTASGLVPAAAPRAGSSAGGGSPRVHVLAELTGDTSARAEKLRRALLDVGANKPGFIPAQCYEPGTGNSSGSGSGGSGGSGNDSSDTGTAPSTGNGSGSNDSSGNGTGGTGADPGNSSGGTGSGGGAASKCTTTAADTLGWGEPKVADEFEGTSISGDWNAYDGPGHGGNGRRTPDAISVADGQLTITGSENGDAGGMAWSPHSQQYGRWEGCAQSPPGAGSLHTLFLLWPTAENWPEGGEVDFMEISDGTGRRSRASCTTARTTPRPRARSRSTPPSGTPSPSSGPPTRSPTSSTASRGSPTTTSPTTRPGRCT